jgi:hypothetical protein
MLECAIRNALEQPIDWDAMRWFTREGWHAADDDSDPPQAVAEYWAHVRGIESLLPTAVAESAHINLHDGFIRDYSAIQPRQATLSIFCGDLQLGYQTVDFHYQAPELIGTTPSEIVEVFAQQPLEILAHELDLGAPGYEHRFLFWPGYVEWAIRFRDLTITRKKEDGQYRATRLARSRDPTG